jgi:dipeptidyl aminopeptidase/acylaminoacyl peptidase
MPTDGSQPAQPLTHTKASESGVEFSADSQKILFSTRRDGDSVDQVYVMRLDHPGEAQKVTESALGAHAAHFTADGQSIVYVTNLWPGATTEAENKKIDKERSEQKAKVRAYEHYPVRYWDQWLDERKPHLMLQSLTTSGAARDLFKQVSIVHQPGFEGRMEDDGARLDYAITTNGQTVIFAASIDGDQSARAFTSVPLWSVSVKGSDATRLTANKDDYGNLHISHDGHFLYALRNAASNHVYKNSHVVRFPINDTTQGIELGAMEDLMAGLDRSASSYTLDDNGNVVFTAEEAGIDVIYTIKIGQSPKKLFAQTRGVYSGAYLLGSIDQPDVIARYESATSPGEIVKIDTKGTNQLLTSFAQAEAAKLNLTPLEAFSFKDTHGHLIHNWLVKPAHFDPNKKYPLIVLMHGGPASMWKDQISLRWNYHLIAQTHYVLVLTDYKGSTGYGEAFANAIEKDPLKGPADEINQAADEAIKRYPFIDGSRQCAAGASYGGHLSNWMQASTHRYKCLVSHAGLVDLTEQWGTSDSNYHREVMIGGPPWEGNPLWQNQSPLHYAKDFKTPVLVTVGERDFRVPLPNTLTYWAALQRQNVPSRLLVFPDENHWILNADNSKRYYQELSNWFAKYLGTP